MQAFIRAGAATLLILISSVAGSAAAPTTQRASAFYPPHLLERIRANAERDDWGRGVRQRAIEAAEPWRAMSDDQLWRLMFGATIPRSWHVFSNGHCPSCEKPVPMYDWKIDALKHPWKVRCPHCEAFFPTNDFETFHASGLDEHGVFDPKRADRTLLFNVDHPDPSDPKHSFGVDDGTGYVDADGRRWRFIGAYLVYGQWKQAVHRGIRALATAYVLSGDAEYAHKAGVLLDRVADLYPTFDFKTQGILYERNRADGYVSVWHDATIETREMALAFDAVRGAIATDEKLAAFLAEKSERYRTPVKKSTAADVLSNIETRILRDALTNRHKIYSNYPQEHLTKAVIHTALDWPANRAQVIEMLDPVIAQTTAVDGTTGEKGLSGYSAYAAQRFAEFLGYYARIDDRFLPEMIERHPRLPQMWRFFIDTWCGDGSYYPTSGDAGAFARPARDYAGVSFLEDHGVTTSGHMSGIVVPSMHSFLWQLFSATNDPGFAQVIYRRNKEKVDGLPFDLFHPDPAGMRRQLQAVIDEHGPRIAEQSTNKTEWHLAVLKSGRGEHARALWLDYDAWGGHGHGDGMNLGLFARGLDLMPDFGYPPVQFGGWESPRANWYKSTLAHNTVTVNGANQPPGATPRAGATTLWAAGGGFNAVGASAPSLNPGITSRFERTVALIDISAHDFYVLDLFRVAGGSDHVRSYTGHFGTLAPLGGLKLEPAEDLSHAQMRNVNVARSAPPGSAIELKLEDRYDLLPSGAKDVRVRYSDFTRGADAYTAEAWVIAGNYNSTAEAWVPRVMMRRRTAAAGEAAPLASTFVTLVQPYAGEQPAITSSRRLALEPAADGNVALAVALADGRRDVIVSADTPGAVTQAQEKLRTDARLALLRRDAAGRPAMIALCGGRQFEADGITLELSRSCEFVQIQLDLNGGAATVIAGEGKLIQLLAVDGNPVRVRNAGSAK